MGTKQENEITVKIKCEINELSTILEKKGFNVVNRFTMNDIFMIPNYIKKEINNLTSREILKKAIQIRDIDNQFKGHKNRKITFKKKEFNNNGDKLIEVETVANNNKINTIEKIKKQIIDLEIPIDATNFFVKKAEIELDKLMNR